jgi:hypothetical protein
MASLTRCTIEDVPARSEPRFNHAVARRRKIGSCFVLDCGLRRSHQREETEPEPDPDHQGRRETAPFGADVKQHHVAHVYEEIGVESRAAAALFAIETCLLAPE